MSLRTRLAAASGLAVAVAVLAVAGAVWIAVRAELRSQVDGALRDRARPFLADHDRPGSPARSESHEQPPGPPAAGPAEYGGAGGFVQFLSPAGRRTRPMDGAHALPVAASARRIARVGAGAELSDEHVAGLDLRVLTAGRPDGGAVQVARPLDEVDHVMQRVLLLLGLTGLIGIALAAGLGAVVARTALAPIARFTRRTEALAAEPDPSERMEVAGSDELARLARSFNTTLDALERSVDAQRHLVADASHELRTPLASLRANVQVLEDAERLPAAERASLHADIIEELDELTALVGDVVELARGAKPDDALDDVRVDLVVTELADRLRRRTGEGFNLVCELEPTVISGEPDRIGRAVSNLLDNARKWSPAGGRIEVTLADGVLTVRDHGPGFPAADLPRVFERFFRADAARSKPGSGLGLAIVHQAAEAHGGWARAGNTPGGGAIVEVSFGPPLPISADERIAGAT